jgi:hypothetical protein
MNVLTKYNIDNIYCQKPIVQLDINKNKIYEYKSISLVKQMGFNPSSIVNARKGKYKNGNHEYKGYLWFYKEDYEAI